MSAEPDSDHRDAAARVGRALSDTGFSNPTIRRVSALDSGFGNVAEVIRLAHALASESIAGVTGAAKDAPWQIAKADALQLLSLLFVLERYVEVVEAQLAIIEEARR